MKLLKGPLMEKMTDVQGTIFKIKRFSVHDGPGIRTAVFLKGCPLNCIWCHSPEGISSDISIWYNKNICIACGRCIQACTESALQLIDEQEPYIEINRNLCNTNGACVNICPSNAIQFTGSITSVSEVIQEVEKDLLFYNNSGGGVTLTGGEPLFQPDFSREILRICKQRNIHTAIETSLFCDREILTEFSDYIDLYIIDIKLFDPVKHKSFTGKSNEVIKENFRYIADIGKEIHVRTPLVNEITDTEYNRKSILSFVHGINKNIPVEFVTFNPLAENNYKRLGIPFLIK